MKTLKTVCALFFCFLLLQFPSHAGSPVWKVTQGANHLYLGGTIHVLSDADYPLPQAFDTAYKNSAVLVLEADLQKVKSPEMRQILIKTNTYPGEQQITQFLQPHTVQELETFLTKRNVPLEQLAKFKPGMFSVFLLSIELQRLGQAGTGVDEFYNLKALNDQRNIVFLETVADQLAFIADMGIGEEDEFIQYTLKDLQDLPAVLQRLKDAWRNGDNTRMHTLALKPLQDEFPQIYASLVVERNNNWIAPIEKMLKTKEVELVLVGSLHLAGDDGVIEQLKKIGCTVENM